MKKRGRPRAEDKRQRVTVFLPASILKKVDAKAKKWGKTRSQIISGIVEGTSFDM